MKKVKLFKIFRKVIIILSIMICISLIILLRNKIDLSVSNSQVDAAMPNLKNTAENEYFELMGFGKLEINETNPYLNLINTSDNKVYLSFDVIYNDNVLYSTKLIEPGKMEQYDIYSCLDAGEHTITYSINVYDLIDKSPLWTGIEQEQEIKIKK